MGYLASAWQRVLAPAASSFASPPGNARVDSLVQRVLQVDRLRNLYLRLKAEGRSIPEDFLHALGMSWRIQKQDLERIPKSGPVLAVANHPFGLLEGVLLTTILPKIRGDFKIVTNSFLAGIPELERFCLFVDPFQSRENLAMNSRALRGAIRWLQSGGLVVIFPAGTVSHWSLRSRHITDPAWNQTAAVLLRKTRAPALPIFFAGGNSLSFQMLGIVHPGLRTSALPREFLKKECGQIEVLIGRLAPYGQLAALGDDAAVTRYLRWRTYLLANRCEAKPCVARGSLIRRKLA